MIEVDMAKGSLAYVSKRQFLNALVCPTQAFFDRSQVGQALDAASRWRFFEGNRVGELARRSLGSGRFLQHPSSEIALAESAAAILKGDQTLYEVTISASGMIARADALVPCEEGWELIEVKSSKMPSSGVAQDDHVDDIAFTICVAQLSGVRIVRASLMLLSREYSLGSSLSIFEKLDVTSVSMARAIELGKIAPYLVEKIAGPSRPEPTLKTACNSCDFFAAICIGQGVEDSILRIPRLSEKKLAELHPCERISALPSSAKLTSNLQLTVDVIKTRTEHYDHAVLAELKNIRWPAFYLDFETVMPALPWFAGDNAYSVIPTQYSVHA